jgi:hypothetical protein
VKIFMDVAVGNLNVCDVTPSENTVNVDLLLKTVLFKCLFLDFHVLRLAPLCLTKPKH